MFFKRRVVSRQDQYWRNRERDFAKARAREASFFLLVFTVVLGMTCWWITQ